MILEGVLKEDGKVVSTEISTSSEVELAGVKFIFERVPHLSISSTQLLTIRVIDPKDSGDSPFTWLRLKGFELHECTTAALANGYQCWSYSPVLTKDEVLKSENNDLQKYFGDDSIYKYAEKPGVFHSFSFSYSVIDGLDKKSGNPFFAAVYEDFALTVFEFDLKEKKFQIAFDVEGLSFSQLDLSGKIGMWLIPESKSANFLPLNQATSAWMEMVRKEESIFRHADNISDMKLDRPLLGYTSWYYKYTDISEKWLLENLKALPKDWNVFQIDDGYQTKVGDWTTFSKGFPNGLDNIIKEVRSRKMIPGIWCAPFVAMHDSEIVAKHPEWLLTDENGERVVCGDFEHWGGKFFAFDTENEGYKKHITEVFSTYFKTWGFKFLKADFLYASGMIAKDGMSRNQRASRAHQFIWDLCRSFGVTFLSCGATLSSAYGRCDFSRIGADVLPAWEDEKLTKYTSREKVSTYASITNALTRGILDGIAFFNDPDVIILRDDDNKLTYDERLTLTAVNSAFGSLIFNSDNLADYDKWQESVLDEVCYELSAEKKGSRGNQIINVKRLDHNNVEIIGVSQEYRSWKVELQPGTPKINLS
jgi:hypothetical protein